MGFMEAYKRLDRLCGDALNNSRGISAYIEEMSRIGGAAWKVSGWEKDLRALRHYRQIRNQIAHDAGCSENSLCTEEDAIWLENFYRRIMEDRDPLALYRQATRPSSRPATPEPTTTKSAASAVVASSSRKPSATAAKKKQSWGLMVLKLFLVALLVALAWAVFMLIQSL